MIEVMNIQSQASARSPKRREIYLQFNIPPSGNVTYDRAGVYRDVNADGKPSLGDTFAIGDARGSNLTERAITQKDLDEFGPQLKDKMADWDKKMAGFKNVKGLFCFKQADEAFIAYSSLSRAVIKNGSITIQDRDINSIFYDLAKIISGPDHKSIMSAYEYLNKNNKCQE